MARFHLLCLAAPALCLTLAVQAAPFTPVAPAGPTPAAALAPAAAATGATAAKDAPVRRTLWLCSLSERLTQLVCVADADPAEQADATDAAADALPTAPAVTAQVNGTRFPLDPQQLWVVDLWTPPSAADDLALLARATICYRSPGCEVRLSLPDLGGRAGGQRLAQGSTSRWRSR